VVIRGYHAQRRRRVEARARQARKLNPERVGRCEGSAICHRGSRLCSVWGNPHGSNVNSCDNKKRMTWMWTRIMPYPAVPVELVRGDPAPGLCIPTVDCVAVHRRRPGLVAPTHSAAPGAVASGCLPHHTVHQTASEDAEVKARCRPHPRQHGHSTTNRHAYRDRTDPENI
jgi:hypothetical protein